MPCLHAKPCLSSLPRLSPILATPPQRTSRNRHFQSTHCQCADSTVHIVPRRALLISLAAASLWPTKQAKAAFGWDGESAALGSCAIGPPGDECRRQVLLRDSSQKEDYKGSQRTSASMPNVGVPVSQMDDSYTKESATLSEAIIKYGTLDLYDPQRVQVINLLKSDARLWTSKYARGGSVRKPSARKIYIVVDALQGHLTSNGFAPFPKAKMAKLLGDMQDAKALLAEGK
ncbi:hypothetical protein WJX77_012084 [Trebouxia sp. C0004]